VYAGCDAISVTSKTFVNYLVREHNIPAHKISYLPQHAEDIGVHPSDEHKDVAEFVFIGNLGISQDIECILEAAAIVRDTLDFKVHLVGTGACFETTKTSVTMRGLRDHVILHGWHPAEDLVQFYRMADACLLTLTADNLIGQTMPGKLQAYMSAGKPVIAATDGAARQVIQDSACGVCVAAGDSAALAAAMTDFIENRPAYEQCGAAGRAYYEEHFTKAHFMRRLEDALISLAGPLPAVRAGELVAHPAMVASPLRASLGAYEEPVA